jgi:hypothetical protein
MSQERLNGLTTLCIEKRLLDEIDIDTILDWNGMLFLTPSRGQSCILFETEGSTSSRSTRVYDTRWP